MSAPVFVALALVAGCDAEPDRSVAGIYNIVDIYDTTNLELGEDGTFRTLTEGCDFGRSSSGVWSMDGDVIVLDAVGDSEDRWREGVCPGPCFGWGFIGPTGSGGTAPVEEVRLVPQPNGTYNAQFVNLIGGLKIDDQAVAAGGECRVCTETGGEVPCDDPFAHDPFG